MERIEEDILELKNKFEDGLYEYRNDHYYIDYSYLSDNSKKFLRRSKRQILKLREILKEQEEVVRLNYKKRKNISQD
jgi:hypothetical protein